MNENDSTDSIGFLGRQHNRLRFTELTETFFGRVLLSKCPDPRSRDVTQVQVGLADLYRQASSQELENCLKDVTFEISNKATELMADCLNTICGTSLAPHTDSQPAVEYFTRYMESRLRWLQTGDKSHGKLPCIENCTLSKTGQLPIFNILVRPAVLAENLARDVQSDLELGTALLRDLLLDGKVSGDPTPRIDYRKQVDNLIKSLDDRQRITGEREFVIHSDQIPFRWALSYTASGLTMPSLGTTTAQDKVMLPLLLEINGLLDIHTLDLVSAPTDPNDVVVRYFVSRPALRNLFGATGQGLEPACRSRLSETELCLYDRLHRSLSDNLVFGGRPRLEMSFGTICSWLIHKAAYCLEEPTFLRNRVTRWLAEHANDKRLDIEDDLFLPLIYERLREEFGGRVVKKPERFAGEIDILFEDVLPIELKVRRGRHGPLAINELDESFRPGSQAAAYAAVSRLGFVVVLDLPEGDPMVVNLERCASVIVRRIPPDSDFPTCIVVVVFHCHHPRPSSTR